MREPDLEGVVLDLDDARLLGGLYRAAGMSRGPAVLVLHGIPGHERLLDLALECQARGIHAMYLHYRGSWGSTGRYSLTTLLDDVGAALDWLRDREDVDPSRVGLLGISLGGWAALAAAAADLRVAAAAALSPLIDPNRVSLSAADFAGFAAPLSGTSGPQLAEEWHQLTPIGSLAQALHGRPVLLVSADQDAYFPPEHYRPLVQQVPSIEWVRFPRADHLFTQVRPGLRHVVTHWLIHSLAPPAAAR